MSESHPFPLARQGPGCPLRTPVTSGRRLQRLLHRPGSARRCPARGEPAYLPAGPRPAEIPPRAAGGNLAARSRSTRRQHRGSRRPPVASRFAGLGPGSAEDRRRRRQEKRHRLGTVFQRARAGACRRHNRIRRCGSKCKREAGCNGRV